MTTPNQPQANADCARLATEAIALGCDAASKRIVYVSPGSRSTPMVVALHAHPHVELRVVLDERAAAFAALGAATASGRTVCTLCTSGSAAAHALPAVMEAYHAGISLVVLTADRPQELQAIGASQTTHQQSIYAQHSRASFSLPAPVATDAPARRHVEGAWRLHMAQAMQRASTPTPGPVHVNLPFRDPLGTQPSSRTDLPSPVHLGALTETTVCEDALERAVQIMQGAKCVAVLVGSQFPPAPSASSLSRALLALARKMHWPVFVESSANIASDGEEENEDVNETNGLCLIRCPDAWASIQSLPASLRPDAWLHLGLMPSGRATSQVCHDPAARHVIFHPTALPVDGALVGDVLLAGDPSVWLRAWYARAVDVRATQVTFAQQTKVLAQRIRSRLRAQVGEVGFFEGQALSDIIQHSEHHTAFVLGNSLTVRDIDTFACWTTPHANQGKMFARRGVSGIDGALAHAAGVLQEIGDRPLVCLLGDLTFLYDVQSLRLLSEQQKAVRIVVLDNHGGEIFSHLPVAREAQDVEALFRAPQQADAQALCLAQGARFVRCATRHQLLSHLSASQATAGDAHVEVLWLSFSADARQARRDVVAQIKNTWTSALPSPRAG